MQAVTHGTWRRGPRNVALDPFGVRGQDEATAGRAGGHSDSDYGCVDWYAYGAEPLAHEARKPPIRGGVRKPSDGELQ